jgi:hypothetical protein
MMPDGSIPELHLFEPGQYVTAHGITGHGIGQIVRFTGAGTYLVRFPSGRREIVNEGDLSTEPPPRRVTPAPPLRFLSYRDMLNLDDPEWLIEGVIQERTSALLFGKSNTFKSFLAIDMACSVATGHLHGSWHGQKIVDGFPVSTAAS